MGGYPRRVRDLVLVRRRPRRRWRVVYGEILGYAHRWAVEMGLALLGDTPLAGAAGQQGHLHLDLCNLDLEACERPTEDRQRSSGGVRHASVPAVSLWACLPSRSRRASHPGAFWATPRGLISGAHPAGAALTGDSRAAGRGPAGRGATVPVHPVAGGGALGHRRAARGVSGKPSPAKDSGSTLSCAAA